jgi:hypothetical protein
MDSHLGSKNKIPFWDGSLKDIERDSGVAAQTLLQTLEKGTVVILKASPNGKAVDVGETL